MTCHATNDDGDVCERGAECTGYHEASSPTVGGTARVNWNYDALETIGTAHLARPPTATYHAGPWGGQDWIWNYYYSPRQLDYRARRNMLADMLGWPAMPWGCADAPPW